MIDEQEPAIQSPRQVKIQMLEVGICGTDKEICRFEYSNRQRGRSTPYLATKVLVKLSRLVLEFLAFELAIWQS